MVERWLTQYIWSSAICTIAMCKHDVVKTLVTKVAARGTVTNEFLNHYQVPPPHALNLRGRAVDALLVENYPPVKFICMDMWGRAGRARKPTAGHFNPRIQIGFTEHGIRVVFLPPKGCLVSCQEPLHNRLQMVVRKWHPPQPREDPAFPRRKLVGPQNFMQLQIVVSQIIGEWRVNGEMHAAILHGRVQLTCRWEVLSQGVGR